MKLFFKVIYDNNTIGIEIDNDLYSSKIIHLYDQIIKALKTSGIALDTLESIKCGELLIYQQTTFKELKQAYKNGNTELLLGEIQQDEDLKSLAVYNLHQHKVVLDHEEVEITRTDSHEALANFKRLYPRNRIWQLAVDGELYARVTGTGLDNKESGWADYEEREPGSLKAFCYGLNESLKNFDDKTISHDLICHLHASVAENVDLGQDNKKMVRGRYKQTTPPGFTLFKKNGRVTQEGLADLLNAMEAKYLGEDEDWPNIQTQKTGSLPSLAITSSNINIIKDQFFHERKIPDKSNESLAKYLLENYSRYTYEATFWEEIKNVMDSVIKNYNEKIQSLTNSDVILQLIGETTQSFERTHPFGDANGRTFVNLLQNRLLMQNGFPPATLFQPNLYDAFGNHIAVLKRGMQNTLEIYAGKDIFGYYMHLETSREQQQLFLDMPCLSEFSMQEFINPILTLKDISNVESVLETLHPLDDVLFKLACIDDAIAKIDPSNSAAICLLDNAFNILTSNLPDPKNALDNHEYYKLKELEVRSVERRLKHLNLIEKIKNSVAKKIDSKQEKPIGTEKISSNVEFSFFKEKSNFSDKGTEKEIEPYSEMPLNLTCIKKIE